jgi:hypothetical protein
MARLPERERTQSPARRRAREVRANGDSRSIDPDPRAASLAVALDAASGEIGANEPNAGPRRID